MISSRVGSVTVHIIELDIVIQIASNKVNSVRDLDGLGKLSVRLEVPCLISRIFENNVGLRILERLERLNWAGSDIPACLTW